jgi:nitroreductase
MSQHAQPDHPVHELIAARWSPYCLDPRPVEADKLAACLEAARWAASSYNEQPWSFVVARREDTDDFAKLLGCLMEANQAWARNAGVLLLTVISTKFQRNGNPNRVALHDLGLAAGNLCLQATALGLSVHQMAGVDLSKARQAYAIPESHEPATVIAIGYAATSDAGFAPQLVERDHTPRTRKPLREFVYRGHWGQSAFGDQK